jgi:heptosyltransferase-1
VRRQINTPAKVLDRWSGYVLGRALGGIARGLGRFGRSRLENPPRQILLSKFCCMGDAVLVLPSLRALKETFPTTHVTMLCTPRTLPIFEGNEYLDEIMLFRLTGENRFGKFVTSALPALLETLQKLRARSFDAVIDFDNYYNWTTFLGFAAGIRTRVGFDPPRQGRRFLLTNPVRFEGARHMVEFYLDLVRAIGADTVHKSPSIVVPFAAQSWARDFLAKSGHLPGERPLVALSPGRSAAWHFVRWPEDNFVAAGRALYERCGARLLLIGGDAEVPIADRMMAALAAHRIPAINSVGKLELAQSEALLQQADLVICNDSGPMHVAAAVGTPTLAVFGPADHRLWGPYGPEHRVVRLDLDCSPCVIMGKLGKCPRQLLECLQVPVNVVIKAADEMLEHRRASAVAPLH